MKLTKLQRHTAYCIMLREFEEMLLKGYVDRFGFCWTVTYLFFDHTETDYWEGNILYFKEILKHRPDKPYQTFNDLWFDYTDTGIRKRIKILKSASKKPHKCIHVEQNLQNFFGTLFGSPQKFSQLSNAVYKKKFVYHENIY